jgi:hypothetical protein
VASEAMSRSYGVLSHSQLYALLSGLKDVPKDAPAECMEKLAFEAVRSRDMLGRAAVLLTAVDGNLHLAQEIKRFLADMVEAQP